MKKILVFNFALTVLGVVYGNLDPWDILPPHDDWKSILKSFESPKDVDGYVRIYVAPFAQLQHAELNPKLSPDTIKTSVVALLDLSQQACKAFNVTEDIFLRRQRDDFRKALENATGLFNEPNAQQLEPVFRPRTIRNFLFQRFDDMLVASSTFRDLQERCRKFERYTRFAHLRVKEWEPETFKYLVTRNIDLLVVRRYSMEQLKANLNKDLKKRNVYELEWKLKSLGNDASHLNLLGWTAALFTMFLTLFFILM